MKKLKDFQTKDGWYEYAEIDYQSAGDLLMGMLGFCQCGSPSTALSHVLAEMRSLKTTKCPDKSSTFFLYWADREGLTEHGSSIYGSWLSEKGEGFLKLLEEWAALPEADDE